MDGLKKTDLRHLIDLFETELNLVPKLAKIEKMKMRSKIRRELYCLMVLSNQTAPRLLKRLEEKLPEVFSACPYEFSDKLRRLIETLLAKNQKEGRRHRFSSQPQSPVGGTSPYSTRK